jgi:hypothetical protein
MLGFRWVFQPAGAPDNDTYINGVDRLCDGAGTPLQGFAKPAAALAPPSALVQGAVDRWLGDRGLDRAVVMVHGFDFRVAPGGAPEDDPFQRVYAAPGHQAGDPVQPESWLPIVGETDEAGTPLADCAVAFGWDSLFSFLGDGGCLQSGFQYGCLEVAPLASKALATVLTAFQNKPVRLSVMAHSLGTRTAVQALRRLADAGLDGLVERIVLIEGSEFSVDAFDAARRLPTTAFFNIGNQKDHWPPRGAWDCHPFRYNGTAAQRVISRDGVTDDLPNLVDLQLDRGTLRTWATAQGYDLDPTPVTQNGQTREEHWAAYIHAGNRRFIRDLLRAAERTPAWFRANQAPTGFASDTYGGLRGVAIPSLPQTCAARLHANHSQDPPVA